MTTLMDRNRPAARVVLLQRENEWQHEKGDDDEHHDRIEVSTHRRLLLNARVDSGWRLMKTVCGGEPGAHQPATQPVQPGAKRRIETGYMHGQGVLVDLCTPVDQR